MSVERSAAVRHSLTDIRASLTAGAISREEAARQVVSVVELYGLQPVEALPALDPITEDDVGVVCWMAVLQET